jgi:hypothetical protein
MIDVAAARQARDERNRLRVEAGLPQLSAEGELQKLSKTEHRKAFDEFCDPPHFTSASKKSSSTGSGAANNDPDWRPTGALSRGGWAFYLSVRKCMRWIWLRQQRKT